MPNVIIKSHISLVKARLHTCLNFFDSIWKADCKRVSNPPPSNMTETFQNLQSSPQVCYCVLLACCCHCFLGVQCSQGYVPEMETCSAKVKTHRCITHKRRSQPKYLLSTCMLERATTPLSLRVSNAAANVMDQS